MAQWASLVTTVIWIERGSSIYARHYDRETHKLKALSLPLNNSQTD